ncbi:MAG: TonB C-terminal domain-containing protein [Gammaproteobacteria bacterium WSBS_2016_MAG_OTU1]
MYLPSEEWDEVGKWKTAVQTFLMLAGFVIFVAVLGDWKISSNPPQVAQQISLVESPRTVVQEKEVEEKTKEEIIPPEPKEAIPTKAEIAKKKEKEEKEKEEKRKKEEEKKEKERKKKEEEKKLAEEKRKKEAEQKRVDDLAAAKIAAEKAARAQVLAGLQDQYIGRIVDKIEYHLQTPHSAKKVDDLVVVVEVHLDLDGNFLALPEVVESSSLPEYDDAAIRAVLQAIPLPMPREPELQEEFRTLRLHISPK